MIKKKISGHSNWIVFEKEMSQDMIQGLGWNICMLSNICKLAWIQWENWQYKLFRKHFVLQPAGVPAGRFRVVAVAVGVAQITLSLLYFFRSFWWNLKCGIVCSGKLQKSWWRKRRVQSGKIKSYFAALSMKRCPIINLSNILNRILEFVNTNWLNIYIL